jgi:hypothetical protein
MAYVWRTQPRLVSSLQRCLAAFFAQFALGSGSTYQRLITVLRENGSLSRTTFATLNYDCLLEAALALEGRAVDYRADAASTHKTAAVRKLHGSCNFIHVGVVARGTQFSGVTFGGDVRFVQPSAVASEVEANDVPPVIAVFMEGKPVQSSPAFLTGLQSRWAQDVAHADVVGLVGVGLNRADQHIWKPLEDSSARCVVIGNQRQYQEWFALKRRGRDNLWLGQGFHRTWMSSSKF